MRLPLSAHAEDSWLVCDIARDFTLDEVWEFPIAADASKGETFRSFCAEQDAARAEPLPGLAEWLVRLRLWLGRVLGLDRNTNVLSIPGCSETSVWERLKPEARKQMRSPDARLPFRLVYDLETERLLEFSNGTVHGLLHLGWVRKQGEIHAPRMAVYIKPRGWFGRLYMTLIYPFRVLVVYPAIVRASTQRWRRRGERPSATD